MVEDRQVDHLYPLYLYEEVKGLVGINLDRQLYINEALQNYLYASEEVGLIVWQKKFLISAEPSTNHGILIIPPYC